MRSLKRLYNYVGGTVARLLALDEIMPERRKSMKRLYTVIFLMFGLLALGTVSLAYGLRSQGIEHREALTEENRSADKRICDGQNQVRREIRKFVNGLSDDPDTEKAINKAFKDLPCKDIANGDMTGE